MLLLVLRVIWGCNLLGGSFACPVGRVGGGVCADRSMSDALVPLAACSAPVASAASQAQPNLRISSTT